MGEVYSQKAKEKYEELSYSTAIGGPIFKAQPADSEESGVIGDLFFALQKNKFDSIKIVCMKLFVQSATVQRWLDTGTSSLFVDFPVEEKP